MTLRSSKNHPTILANTRPWKPLECVFVGAWLFAALPAAVLGETPTSPGRASVTNESSNRSAMDRWRRLKTLYSLQESASEVDRDESEPRSQDDGKLARPIPADTVVETKEQIAESNVTGAVPVPADIEEDVSSIVEDAAPARPMRPTLPILPVDEEPAWILPIETEPTAERDFRISDSDDGGVHALEPSTETSMPVSESRTIAEKIASLEKAVPVKTVSKQVAHSQIAPVRYRKIGSIIPFRDRNDDGRESDSDIREWAHKQSEDLNLAFGVDPYADRAFPAMVKAWDAPNFFHYPLYFEDPALERYGHKHGGNCCCGCCSSCSLIQPAASIARFSTQLVFLPYQMAIDAPCREVYTLGWYRPGECAPKLRYQVPLNCKAAAVQAATVTGLVFLIP